MDGVRAAAEVRKVVREVGARLDRQRTEEGGKCRAGSERVLAHRDG
jgi:hypothetical protein